MDRYMLNIGLLESSIIGNGRRIPASKALEVVQRTTRMVFGWDAVNIAHAVHDSGSEPTLIVKMLTFGTDHDRVQLLADALCSRLRQEAIALAKLDDSGHVEFGELRGPMAERWGEFNPEYFLLLNGQRAAMPSGNN